MRIPDLGFIVYFTLFTIEQGREERKENVGFFRI